MATREPARTVEPYSFHDTPDGFEITRSDRNPVRVRLRAEDFLWQVQWVRTGYLSNNDTMLVDGEMRRPDFHSGIPVRARGGSVAQETTAVSNAHQLVKLCANALVTSWESPKHPKGANPWFGAREWTATQCQRSIGRGVADRWRKILDASYTPEFVALLNRIFSVTFRHPSPDDCDHLFRIIEDDPQMVKDLHKYRGAAHAFLLLRPDVHKDMFNSDNWIAVFGEGIRDGLSRSKRRTIMNLPHGVSSSALAGLCDVSIDRPIFTRLGLNWAGALVRSFIFDPSVFPFFYATDEDIIKAAQRFAPYESPRKTKTLFSLAQYICDMFRDMTNREVLEARAWKTANAVTKRAIRWHRELIERDMLQDIPTDATETALPPIDLPEDEHIRFLATPEEVVKEASLMGHCVYLYVGAAVQGRSYLFHTDYKGEMATTEIRRDGHVAQSVGPHNVKNRASRYAARVLGRWAKEFPETGWQRARREYEENHQNIGLHAIRVDEDGMNAIPIRR